MGEYTEFLKKKAIRYRGAGKVIPAEEVHPLLFPFQRDLVVWALRKGRAAIFADTGLGKTFCQLEWARLMGGDCLIVAPLSVARQTQREAEKIGITTNLIRGPEQVKAGINVINYENVHKVDPAAFEAVVLDESSILKSLDGKTRQLLTEMFADTEYKLCCTATPAPNDIAELANHAEFLSIMSRANMLATFFVHDADGWRLKGHAEKKFYEWLASWGMSIKKPSDLGYDDNGFILPELQMKVHEVEAGPIKGDALFFMGLKGIQDRLAVRQDTLEAKIAHTAELVADDAQWILWCGLNTESDALAKAIPDAIVVEGSQEAEVKAQLLEEFQDGKHRILITKAKIAGFGMNFQNCHKMAFVGLSDSWEAFYQSVRRCYRFGQTKPVEVHVVISELEKEIYHNVMNKQEEAEHMTGNLIEHAKTYEEKEIHGIEESNGYKQGVTQAQEYTLMLGDCVERLKEVGDSSVDLSVFSPPFLSLYTYSPTERDLGNSRGKAEFFEHFGYVIKELFRTTKDGRICCCHVSQVPATKVNDGYIGLKDFRGWTIEAFQQYGWIYHGDVVIDKDPQAQAIRTKSKSLMFVQLHKDSSWSRPGLADYILLFRKPGENQVPVEPDINNEQWIEWARPIWYGIKETETLNVAEARENEDERHICPLQLGTIERCIRLWSNKGETVLSPFAGIGSEGYMALKLNRRFIGIELKESYYETAKRNLLRAIEARDKEQMPLFATAKGGKHA